MAMAGVDIAAWDILAKAAGLPLVRLLGGHERPIPAYNSCGLGISTTEHLLAEARDLTASGFGAVKVRLGYPDSAADVAAVRAVRQAVGDGVLIMSDYNQSLSVPEAQQRARAARCRGAVLDRGTDPGRGLCGSCPDSDHGQHADPDWRELLGAERHGQGIGGRSV